MATTMATQTQVHVFEVVPSLDVIAKVLLMDEGAVLDFLKDSKRAPKSKNHQIDLSKFNSAWKKLNTLENELKPISDKDLSVELHEALIALPRRLMLDPGFWVWLSLFPLREYVLARWAGGNEATEDAQFARFHCTASVGSIGQTNASARLYWASEIVFGESGSYKEVSSVIGIQDLHKTLFSNKISLDAKLLLATARTLSTDYREKVAREVIKMLGVIRPTTMFSSLSDADLQILLSDLKKRAEVLFPGKAKSVGGTSNMPTNTDKSKKNNSAI